ncbi:FeoB-associated Cys-rich membrane protein [Staphylococcus gallinarum]|uniref:FeoB-associated Cys-rich membrane protein n=1 Tax=Staphylococcus gallinarum TaxID=1293 RepID=UPI001E5354C7|nr:FeoB-associated Cys-rich membrane protein [Staphylococcus gallinarum]MCD8844187.1 FeoB-associated Cys-rich membrane protein [Staphylococcus gallinarum]
MTIIFNIILFAAIFGYAAYTLTKFIKKSKAGKCSSCGSSKHCNTPKPPSHIFSSNDHNYN